MAQHHERHTMSDPTISDEPMVDPDVTAIIYAESAAETMNYYYAEEGIAYPVSGDYLANWDGRGPARAAERRLKRLAAPAIKYVMDYIDIAPVTRYWKTPDGRIHRNRRMKPLIHNGGKP